MRILSMFEKFFQRKIDPVDVLTSYMIPETKVVINEAFIRGFDAATAAVRQKLVESIAAHVVIEKTAEDQHMAADVVVKQAIEEFKKFIGG